MITKVQTAICSAYDAGQAVGKIQGIDIVYRKLYTFVKDRPALPAEYFDEMTELLYEISMMRAEEHQRYLGLLNIED